MNFTAYEKKIEEIGKKRAYEAEVKRAGSEAALEAEWSQTASLEDLEKKYTDNTKDDPHAKHVFQTADGVTIEVPSADIAELLRLGVIKP